MILSIESSCDDSAIAITEIDSYKLLFHKKISQELEHAVYGGVVPELAARLHAETLPKILAECEPYYKDLKAVAVTSLPGLAVTLVEGVTMAKAIAVALNIPIIGVNHLIGHIYSLFIEKPVEFPLTVLLVSGGHTQVMEVESLTDIKTVAKSMDDSFGESFDKVAKMMGLDYPGGPLIQELAKNGDRKRYNFTVPLHQSPLLAFSYSGLKNAVRLAIEKSQKQDYPDIAASFEHIACKHLTQKLKKYFKTNPPKTFAIVGGASANLYLRSQISELLKPFNVIGRVAVDMYKQKLFSSILPFKLFLVKPILVLV